MTYASSFFRGISLNDYVTKEGYVLSGAFQFDSYDSDRGDLYCELSINWNDNGGALETLLNQHKSNSEDIQFKVGYCCISLSNMKKLLRPYIDNKDFSYERRPINECIEKQIQANPYHGNLLLKDTVSKAVKKSIENSLATLGTATFVRRT